MDSPFACVGDLGVVGSWCISAGGPFCFGHNKLLDIPIRCVRGNVEQGVRYTDLEFQGPAT